MQARRTLGWTLWWLAPAILTTACGEPRGEPRSERVAPVTLETRSEADRPLPPAVRQAFHLLADCGAVKVNAARPIYLTALHCLQGLEAVAAERSETLQLGDLVNYEWIVRYGPGLEGADLGEGRRVLASGREWTGYALDVLKEESEDHVREAAAALLNDWVLLEDPSAANAASDACLPFALTLAPATTVLVVGREGDRPGRAVSEGTAVGPDFTDDERYQFRDAWTAATLGAVQSMMTASTFAVTDASVWPGMSGGPVVDLDGTLVAVTTVKLEPNFCQLPGDACTGYLYATHGGIMIQGILAARPDVAAYFDCSPG